MILEEKGYFDKSSTIIDTKFGVWNEVDKNCIFLESEIGDYTYFGDNCDVAHAKIGKFCSVAKGVRINPANHPMERATQHHFTYRRKMFQMDIKDDEYIFQWRRDKKVVIGNDVWIGHNAIIMGGITIGDGAVIGSGSVVTKDVAPYTVVAGVPAKFIKRRFSERITKELMEIRWWNWSRSEIKERMGDFVGDIEKFIEKYKN